MSIQAFVMRAMDCLLEQEVSALNTIATGTLDRLPGLQDERRKRAHDDMAAADVDEARLTDDLADERLTFEAYTRACHRLVVSQDSAPPAVH